MEKYTTKFEKLEKSAVKLTLTFSSGAVTEAYNADLAKYAKQLTLNGFRKGKAPVSLIESKYGDTIINETFTGLLDKAVGEIFTPADEKDAPADEFKPMDSRALDLMNEKDIFPIKKGQDVVCEIKYDVYPQFELGQYKGLKVEYSAPDYDPKVEDDEIEAIRARNAVIEEKKSDVAEEGDIATVDLAELADDGAEIEASRKDGYVFTLSKTASAPYELDADVIGMKVGASRTVAKEYGKDSAYPEQKKTWKVTLSKLKVRTLPELDDEFAQDVSERYKTMADMRKDIHDKAFGAYQKSVEAAKVEAALDAVAKSTEIAVPDLMVANSIEEKWYGFVQNFTGNGQRSFADTEKYLSGMGMTKESYLSMMGDRYGEENLMEIKKGLVLSKIEEVEKTQENDEDKIAKFIEDNKIDTKQYGEAYEPMVKAQIKEQLGRDNAIKFIVDNNEFVKAEPKAAATDKAPAAPSKASGSGADGNEGKSDEKAQDAGAKADAKAKAKADAKAKAGAKA